jgi:hypothetical protein
MSVAMGITETKFFCFSLSLVPFTKGTARIPTRSSVLPYDADLVTVPRTTFPPVDSDITTAVIVYVLTLGYTVGRGCPGHTCGYCDELGGTDAGGVGGLTRTGMGRVDLPVVSADIHG